MAKRSRKRSQKSAARPGRDAPSPEDGIELAKRTFGAEGRLDELEADAESLAYAALRRVIVGALADARRMGPEVGHPTAFFVLLGDVMREDPEIGAHPRFYDYCEKMMSLAYAGAEASRKRYGLEDDEPVH